MWREATLVRGAVPTAYWDGCPPRHECHACQTGSSHQPEGVSERGKSSNPSPIEPGDGRRGVGHEERECHVQSSSSMSAVPGGAPVSGRSMVAAPCWRRAFPPTRAPGGVLAPPRVALALANPYPLLPARRPARPACASRIVRWFANRHSWLGWP